MHSRAKLLTRLLPLAGLVLCGGLAVASEAAAPRSSAFGPGEQFQFEISYLGITSAHAQVTVGAQTEQFGRQVWPIVATVQTDAKLAFYPVRDKFVTYWDFEKGRTVGSDFMAHENNRRRRQKVRLNHEAQEAMVTRQHEGSGPNERSHTITEGAGDVAAVAFALRNHPLAVGREFQLPVFTGQKSFMLKAKVEGIEKMDTELGKKDVFKVRIGTDFSGKFASKGDVFAYLTTDEAHLPVRIDAEFVLGKLSAQMVDYKAGRQIALRD